MRKIILIVLLSMVSILGQGIKISQLPNTTTLGNSDLLLVVVDSSGTKITKNITVPYFSTALAGKISTTNLTEGTNLYYTDARAITALTGNNNTWTNVNTHNGDVIFNGQLILPSIAPSSNGAIWYGGISGSGVALFNYGTTQTDTLASQRWVRNNYPTITNFVDLSSSQNVTGTKTMSVAIALSLASTPFSYVPNSDITTLTLTGNRSFWVITPPVGGISGISGISGGNNGQILIIMNDPDSGNGGIGIKTNVGGNIYLTNGTNITLSPGSTIILVNYNSKWYQTL